MKKDISQKQNEQEMISHPNLHVIIENIRKQLLQKINSHISNINSINPFNEIKLLSTNDFQQELSKYNVSVDSSYIEGVIFQMNTEIFRQLLIKTKQNILQNIITTSNDVMKPLTNTDLIQNYGIDLDNEHIDKILEYVNSGIKSENKKIKKSKRYQRLTECFVELAETDVQKDAIEQIMKTGKYNGFKLNSMLSNEKNSEKAEMERRIAFSEMILHDKGLFFYLANNGLNVFHGTKIDALQTILSKGLFCSSKLSENEIQLRTGEEQEMTKSIGGNAEKRNFISLTDDFDTSALYAGFPYEEQTEYVKKYYGKDLTSDEDVPIIICFNGTNIEQKYGEPLVTVKSTCNEIGINSSINPSDIKCIITSYDKMEYVKSITSKFRIDVLGYDHNDKFEKRFYNKEGKFYSKNMEIDEEEFGRTKEKLKVRKNNENSLGNNSTMNKDQSTEHLSEDLSMMLASDIKMDTIFDLMEQYNNGVPVAPMTVNDFITKYNMNENVAQRLTLEINNMLEGYIKDKEQQMKNYIPYVLDDSEKRTNPIDGKRR